MGAEQPTVGSVMHEGVVTCDRGATLREVAGLLARHRIHAVVVATGDERISRRYAVVTDRDVVYGHARGRLDSSTAQQAASEPTVTVRADLDLRYASELMSQNGTSHLVVVSPEDGSPVGIVSSLDVARAVSG